MSEGASLSRDNARGQQQAIVAETINAMESVVADGAEVLPAITSSVRKDADNVDKTSNVGFPSVSNNNNNAAATVTPISPLMTSIKSPKVKKHQKQQASRDGLDKSSKEAEIKTEQFEEPGRLNELKRFTLWETKTMFYLVAYNTSQTRFRILKVDRTPEQTVKKQSGENPNFRDGNPIHQAQDDDAPIRNVKNGKSGPGETAPGEQPEADDALKWTLNVTSDRVVYTRSQVSDLLDMISEGNKSTGGIKEVGRFFGIIGFIRFTSTYYMVLISKRSVVGLLGGHYIYHCDETKILPVCHANVLANLSGRTKFLDQEEARLLHTFKQVDLSKNFYFSYTYDLTKTLQDNLIPDESNRTKETMAWGYNEKFIWNHHLLLPAFAFSQHKWKDNDVGAASEWVLPLVYGFVDQAKLCVLNCTIHVTLIARRSRHFAGARFLKRGTDENGHVANDVETEQIVSEALTTPFYAPNMKRRGEKNDKETRLGPNPRYTSYVMHRGSIPIYWTQDSTNMSPRPPIEISVVDPYYSSAALHFDDMLRRYGHPIIVLNLIKSKEKQPREVKLLGAFGECVGYLNQFLPLDKKLRYIAWDMSRASKSRDQDVIGVLEDIAEETVNATKFFHSGPEPNSFAFGNGRKQRRETILLQSGVARVNCVDCLDRTNAAQFVIGKAAFGHQLHALGLLDDPTLPFDSAAVDMLTEMYHDLGDTIALQYGGSHLVNTMETYRKINQWTSHSRDMLEGLKRYYANSFVDADKQAAINLFLGVDTDGGGGRGGGGGGGTNDSKPLSAATTTTTRRRRHYQQWFTPEYLEPRDNILQSQRKLSEIINAKSSFWAEYYRPSLFTDLLRHHAFKMTAVHQHMPTVSSISSTISFPPNSSPSMSSSLNHQKRTFIESPSLNASTSLASGSNFTLRNATPTTMSPFTSRVASTLTGPLTSLSKSDMRSTRSPGGLGSPRPQQKAVIGGVRRWISLNRGENTTTLSPRKTSASAAAASRKASRQMNEVETESNNGASSLSSESAWPTWEEITGALVTAPSTETLLDNLADPSVSVEEAKEYAWWLDQFRDVTFDGGLPTSIPEPAALMMPVAPPSGIGMAPPLYQIGIRRPATQKQRQQIAESDAQLYDYEVGISLGQASSLEKLHQDHEEEGKIDSALLQYPLSANTLNTPTNERKARAFSHWITGHNRNHTLPLLKV